MDSLIGIMQGETSINLTSFNQSVEGTCKIINVNLSELNHHSSIYFIKME